MSRPSSVVVVGASLAGTNVAQELRRLGYEDRITLIGAESQTAAYDRTELSKGILTGAKEVSDLALLDKAEIDALECTRHLGQSAAGLTLNGAGGEIQLDNGTSVAFDKLVIATGSTARHPSWFRGLTGCHVLRDLGDAIQIRTALDRARNVVVIGTGFIGCEVAASIRSRGQSVTLLGGEATPMWTALGPVIGGHYTRLHRDEGTNLIVNVGVKRLHGATHVSAVELLDGRVFPADLVIAGIGGDSATSWLQGSGMDADRGVICDSGGNSSHPSVMAAGDAANWYSPYHGRQARIEHWNHAALQATTVAENLLGGPSTSHLDTVPTFWTDQFGHRLQMVGSPNPEDDVEIVDGAPEDGKFVACYRRGERTTAVVAFNSVRGVIKYRGEITNADPVASTGS